ncbi:putative clathrin assembly protein At1g03050 [Cajanus cajan]|uniref:Clathrin assembly protein At1g03050 family n=1 Tax=Cajanus cajan TaxID=3821 RepID=A0A151T7U3_CAJCA|nr:putative clathrin assembly protein At1g03050 [Cajanus cajan]XP_029128319.1 putative clathrin assembly protein At1g03050 [Cajanus cajan]KYP63107.1 Putative clathrin assembly protein At1g03050 family [Cajanus cajan]
MPPSSKLRRALGAVKDQTSIGLAKVGSSTSLADLDVAIVKATRHDEYPAEEKHIREILSLTCYSRAFISACVNTLARRLNKTKSWTVALKTLVLIQRLLVEGDPAYEQEIFFSTRRGTRVLNLSDFRDNSKAGSWDFSAFVRTYALYLDERLEYKMQSRRGRRSMYSFDEEEEERDIEKEKEVIVRSTPLRDMKLDQIFSKMQHLQLLLERFLACRPTGEAKNHRIVTVALYPIVKESIQIYYDIAEILCILVDRFPDMEVSECVKVYDIFCRVGKQFDELDLFYGWSKNIGIARSSEYPEIERVTMKKLEVMEEFIKDKSALAQGYIPEAIEYKHEEVYNEPEPEPQPEAEPEAEEDTNEMKALPPPEETNEEPVEEVKEEKVVQTEGDLLNLGDDTVTNEAYGEKLALALFDGEAPAATGTGGGTQALPWHAFDDGADWETALVQSATNLANQKPTYGGGFDTLLLDGMYKQGEMNRAMQGEGYGVSGSDSSVALGSAGRPAMLALPAPPTSGTDSNSCSNLDPFAASLAVAPPSYVQMSEMEKKQRFLIEEQMMWQQYAHDGMQGQAALAKLHSNNNNNSNMGGYPQNYGNYYR